MRNSRRRIKKIDWDKPPTWIKVSMACVFAATMYSGYLIMWAANQ